MKDWPFGILMRNSYGVIYADPASRFEGYNESGSGVPQTAEIQHYPTMTFPEMARLPVSQLAKLDCSLFIWSTSAQTRNTFWLAEQWGFNHFSGKVFSWAKLNKNAIKDGKLAGDPTAYFLGMGKTSRRNTEDCWLFTRGSPRVMDHGVRELFVEPLREHSRKPNDAYDRIERLYKGPYCELFARNRRNNWSSWGQEVGKFHGQ